MRVSLGFIMGCISAFVVLVVSVVTLSISYTVSLDAVIRVGEHHAEALARGATDGIAAYFQLPSNQITALTDTFYRRELGTPSVDPLLPNTDLIARVYYTLLMTIAGTANYSYPTCALVFDEGSAMNMYPYTPRVAFWFMRIKNLTASNTTSFQGIAATRAFDFISKRDLTPSDINVLLGGPLPPNVDGRFPAYYTAKTLFGPYRSGLWYPVTVVPASATTGTGGFVLPVSVPLFNSTNNLIGLAALAVSIDYINTVLVQAKQTTGTQAFAVDATGYIVGTSLQGPGTNFSFSYVASSFSEKYDPNSCTSSAAADVDLSHLPTIGCRVTPAQYAASPVLQAVANTMTLDTQHVTSASVSTLTVDGAQYFIAVGPVANTLRYWGMTVVLIMPETDVIGDIVTSRNIVIGITIAVFVLAAGSSFLAAHLLLRPLGVISRRMLQTAKLRESTDLDSNSYLREVHDLERAYADLTTAIQSFTRYVPRDVVKDLIASGQLCSISMVTMRCTVLFADIANFTTVCERVPPPVLSELVSLYFERATQILMKHHGLIDKFIGDAIMAVWGAPFRCANQEVKAALAAKLLDRETMIDPLLQRWDEAGEQLRVRVGLSTGDVLAGNMGCTERMNYTVIGDNVNLAARLEGMNKQFGTRIMVSESTATNLIGVFVIRLLMSVAVVGKDQPVRVYELMGIKPAISPEVFDLLREEDERTFRIDTTDDASGSFSASSMSLSMVHVNRVGVVAMLREVMFKTGIPATPVCSEIEAAFARVHSDAVNHYLNRNFTQALSVLKQLRSAYLLGKDTSMPSFEELIPTQAEDRLPNADAITRSVHMVEVRCEAALRSASPEEVDVTFKALEK